MNKSPLIAVIICTYNRSKSLIGTLNSLYQEGYNGSELIDILVVANNCTDNTISSLLAFREAHPQNQFRLRWIEEPKPGKSYALNTAINNIDNEILCFIDDDQIVEPNFLQHLVAGVRMYPNDSIFCGRIWPAWDGSEPFWVHVKGKYAIPIRPFPEFDLGDAPLQISPKDRFPSGGNISVRRKVFNDTGEFSVELGPTRHNLAGGEDHDFLFRAVNKGHTIRYLPGLRQLHTIDKKRTSTLYTMRKSFFRSRSSFLIHIPTNKPHLYMINKIFNHLINALFSFDKNKRIFYLVRLSASIGELAGAIHIYCRPSCKNKA